MKSLTLAAGMALMAFPFTPAHSQVWTLGGPQSTICYQSALAQDTSPENLRSCDRALTEEALTTPDRAATLVNFGILQMLRGADTAAGTDFDEALKINSRLADAWLNKGFLLLRENRGADALPMIQRGISLGVQRRALAIFARGLAHEQMGEFKAAYNDYSRARDLEPEWTLPGKYLARYQVRAE